MWFQKLCSFSERYNHFKGKYCNGDYIKGYTTLRAAKAACSNDIECGCINDFACNGFNTWVIFKGSALASSTQGTCAWTLGKCRPFLSEECKIFNNVICFGRWLHIPMCVEIWIFVTDETTTAVPTTTPVSGTYIFGFVAKNYLDDTINR